jgi:TolB-like protein
LLPVVLDDTRDAEAKVPAEFKAVQWTRLPGGEKAEAFGARVMTLLGGAALEAGRPRPAQRDEGIASPTSAPNKVGRRVPAAAWLAAAALVAAGALYFALRPAPNAGAGTRPPTAEKAAPAEVKSVTVLAFKNVGGDLTSEAWVDGIGLELIAVLGRVPGLTVRGGSSLDFSRSTKATAQEKGRQLAAAYLVDGSVQRAGDTVRITASVTRAATNEIVWTSAPLNRDVKNIFAVQEEIARLIAQALSLKLSAGSAASMAAVKPEAFDLYVQARQAWNQRTVVEYDRAERLLLRALEIEPEFARAHAALADVWLVRGQDDGVVGRFGDRDSALSRQILTKIRHAIQLDPDSAEAHASLGSAYWNFWNFPEAERELRHAIRLNASYASAHQWLGRVLLNMGRIDEAKEELRVAAELDPFSTRIADNRALISLMAGRYSEALALYDRALAVRADNVQATTQKAITLAHLGRGQEAAGLIQALAASQWRTQENRVDVLAQAGLRDEAEPLTAALKMQRYERARMLLLLGKPAEGLAALDADVVLSQAVQQWLYLPVIDPIRGEPAFAKFLATLGLTEAHARAQAWRKAYPPEKPAAK